MEERFERTVRIIGEENLNKLRNARILIFGLGGVGGHATEALCRAGIGHITIVDGDKVEKSNLNRQLIATEKTIGMLKTDAMLKRLKEIDENMDITAIAKIYSKENREEFSFAGYDYVVDAIDDVKAKTDIIKRAKEKKIPVISAMGTGNKMRADLLEVSDIHKTSVCPLAKVMRKELKKEGIKDVKVVYSKENPAVKANPPGSLAFVPAAAGMIMAGEVIRNILER